MPDAATSPAAPVRRPSGFVPLGGLARRQELLGRYYPSLWEEIAARWLPTARPITQANLDNTGGYQRGNLSQVLCSLNEWDGYEISSALSTFYGWHPDATLVGIIHRWSCSLGARIHADRRHHE